MHTSSNPQTKIFTPTTPNIPKMRVFYEHFCRNDRRRILLYIPKFALAFERIFSEPLKIYHGLSFSFFRLLLSFSFSKEKERNGHLLKKCYFKENLLKKLLKYFTKTLPQNFLTESFIIKFISSGWTFASCAALLRRSAPHFLHLLTIT